MDDIMNLPPERLGEGTRVTVGIFPTAEDLYWDIAWRMLRELQRARDESRRAVFIVPVGPVGQYERLARLCNDLRLSLAYGVFFGMDEYLSDELQWISEDHPLSFRAHLRREMFTFLDPVLRPPEDSLIFPDPGDPPAVDRLMADLGGADLCVGGIGITGHLAFNEPPAPGENLTPEEFGALGSRVVELTCETRTINSTTVACGNLDAIPRYAVTLGMRQILSARELRLYANRFWQPSVVRRALHGPVTARFPASLVQLHSKAYLYITEEVSRPAGLRLA